MGFCQEYGWTITQVEDTYLEDLLDMTIIRDSLNESSKTSYIDDIL